MKQIKSIYEILALAKQGKSVYVTVWDRKSPAAFFISWQVKLLDEWIKAGRLLK